MGSVGYASFFSTGLGKGWKEKWLGDFFLGCFVTSRLHELILGCMSLNSVHVFILPRLINVFMSMPVSLSLLICSIAKAK